MKSVKVLLLLFLFISIFWIFELDSSFAVEAEPEVAEGNINFQPNVIPKVNVYYEDYSFVFSYKTYFIRVRPFVIHDGTYWGMKKIVTWIKSNYPNVNYKWLIEKAERAVHYGYNLTKLPQSVADKIDYLGFRLVDLNFPLSWFELEETEVFPELEQEPFEPYNITRIHVPKANLVFTFEDLFPQGYTVQHLNKTYVLVGGVKSKTDLIVDPITYSAPTITITGFTEDDPCTCWDLWNASNVNGWGVAWNLDNVQFTFSCQIKIGDGTTETWFADEMVQVYFNYSVLIAVPIFANAHFRLGHLIDADKKMVERGVTVINKNSGSTIIFHAYAGSEFEMYGSTIIGNSTATRMRVHSPATIYGCTFEKCYFWSSADVQHDLVRTNIFGGQKGFYRCSGVFDDVWVYNTTFAFHLSGSGVYNVTGGLFQNNTYLVYPASLYDDVFFIDSESKNWSFLWFGTCTGMVYRQYTFETCVTNKAYTPIQDANVTINYYGQGGGTIGTWLTYANGSIPPQTLTYLHYNQTGGDVGYDYNPYEIIITKNGYQTYHANFTLDEKKNWNIALDPNTVPIARFTYSPLVPAVTQNITFDASDSIDTDGSIVSYLWDFGDGNNGSGVSVTHNYTKEGFYSVNLTITDNQGLADWIIQKLNVVAKGGGFPLVTISTEEIQISSTLERIPVPLVGYITNKMELNLTLFLTNKRTDSIHANIEVNKVSENDTSIMFVDYIFILFNDTETKSYVVSLPISSSVFDMLHNPSMPCRLDIEITYENKPTISFSYDIHTPRPTVVLRWSPFIFGPVLAVVGVVWFYRRNIIVEDVEEEEEEEIAEI